MNYKEQYDKATEMGLNILDLRIFQEVDSYYNGCFTDAEIETICDKVKTIYLDNEYFTIEAICDGLRNYDCNPLYVDTWDKGLLNKIAQYNIGG